MIKVFTTNKNGKIELTKDELKKLLDEAYWDGYAANNRYVYTTPYWTGTPITTPWWNTVTCSNKVDTNTLTVDAETIKNATTTNTCEIAFGKEE